MSNLKFIISTLALSALTVTAASAQADCEDSDKNIYQNSVDIDRYTTVKYGCQGDCDYNSVSNAMALAEASLWPIVDEPSAPGGTVREPCGSSIYCSPLMAPTSKCFVEVNDCEDRDNKVLETLILSCRGDIACKLEGLPASECCSVIGSKPGEMTWRDMTGRDECVPVC